MELNEKEKKEFKEDLRHKYFDKNGRPEKGVTIGDISRDMGHSNREEIVKISNEITEER